MTAKFVQGTEVTRPEPAPLTSSLLDHVRDQGNVQVINGAFGYVNNAGLYPSYNCLDLITPTAECPDPLITETGDVKEFDSAEWQPGFRFAVYGGVQCRAVGLDPDDQNAEVKRVFEQSMGKGIERAMVGRRFVAQPLGGPDVTPYYGVWDAPEDVTPGTAVSLPVALALLEGNAAASYNGLPTIHMPRAAATILEMQGLIVWNSDKTLAFTKNGSRVAIGGGYDDPEMLETGLWDMYATGDVSIQMADVISVKDWPVLPGMLTDASAGSDEPTSLIENGIVSLAERQFRIGVDCLVLKATGKAF